ncbi:MAG: toprim domain-containing protein [Actinomycetota bacterium]|nr:toprim domain-containing protein [Actinomycetota bacterium]
MRSGDDWRAWLDVASRFHSYSFNNTLLIYAQRPQARAVAGYTAWQALGRQVDKGEKGIQVLAPVTRRHTANADKGSEQPGEEVTTSASATDGRDEGRKAGQLVGFRVAYVWDVDQTSGDPLPEQPRPQLLAWQAPEGLWDSLVDLAETRGFSVERRTCGPANGWTDYTNRTVRVRPDVEDAQAVKTLAHEVGHVLLHDSSDFATDPATTAVDPAGHATTACCRGIKEVEAESVAYLVGTSHGLATDAYTFPYVASWAGSVDAEEPERVVAATGQRVLRAAGSILDATQGERLAAKPGQELTAQVAAGRDRSAAVRDYAEATRDMAAPFSLTQERREVLVAIHEEATRWYVDQLASRPADQGPRAYLADRAFVRDALQQYRVGYAPAEWTALTDHLRACGHRDDVIEASGLAILSSRGNLIDRFRDRIMLPVADETGSVVGFTGRAAPSAGDEVPKYINSPETPIYRKSSVLYGLAEARDALADGARPVVVEGPFDAIAVTTSAAHRYVGIAPCGTALTATQVDALNAAVPLAQRGVIVAFDSDAAGLAAAARAYAPLRATGAWPHAAEMPKGHDPADLAQSSAPQSVIATLDGAASRPLADVLVDEQVNKFAAQLGTSEGRVRAAQVAAKLVAALPPEHVSRQVARLADKLHLDPTTVTIEVLEAVTQSETPRRSSRESTAKSKASTAPPARRRPTTASTPPRGPGARR